MGECSSSTGQPLLGLLSASVGFPKEHPELAPEHEQDWLAVQAVWGWLVRRAGHHHPVEEPDLLQQPDRTAHLYCSGLRTRPTPILRASDTASSGRLENR